MKISVDRNVVEFHPANEQETSELELLWRVMVDCMKDNKKMTPMGNYIPPGDTFARFVIEGIPGGKTVFSDKKSEKTCPYYCSVCNKYMNVNAGDDVPLCCGKLMDDMD